MRPTILLTRPEEGATRFADQLRDRFGSKVRIVLSPVLRIQRIASPVDLSRYAGLIFSSANGVPAGRAGMRCYTVGDATADAARTAGMVPTSAGADAQALIRRILADGETGPLLHLRGAHTRGNIAETLTNAGCKTDQAVVYDQQAQSLSDRALKALATGSPVIVPLFSPRSARVFVDQVNPTARIWAVAISPAVAGIIAASGFEKLLTAEAPTANSMIDAIQGLLGAATRLEG